MRDHELEAPGALAAETMWSIMLPWVQSTRGHKEFQKHKAAQELEQESKIGEMTQVRPFRREDGGLMRQTCHIAKAED